MTKGKRVFALLHGTAACGGFAAYSFARATACGHELWWGLGWGLVLDALVWLIGAVGTGEGSDK